MITIILNWVIPLSIIVSSIILLHKHWKTKKRDNMLKINMIEQYLKEIKKIKKGRSILDKLSSYIILYPYVILQLPANIIRCYFKTKSPKLSSAIDIVVVAELTMTLFLFFFSDVIVNSCVMDLITGYFIWRVLDIYFNELAIINVIDWHKVKKNKLSANLKFASFNRLLLLQSFNFIEVIFAYSFIFYKNNVFHLPKLETLFTFSLSFLTFNYPLDIINKGVVQLFLVYTSIGIYILFIIFIFTNLLSLRYKGWNDR